MTLTQLTQPTRHWRRPVALLLTGQALSLIGSSIVQYAIVWHLVMRTDSGIAMTVIMLCAALPQAVVSLFGGVWADRWSRKLLIMLPDGIIAVVTVALSLFIAHGADALVLFFVVLAIRSAGAGVQTPAVQSFIPDITPEDRLLRVNSINGTIQSVNMIAAPALAAVLVNLVPLWAILYVDVTTASIGIVFVALIRAAKMAPTSARSVVGEMRAGLRYAWRFPRIRAVLVSYTAVCFINIAPMNLTMLLMNRGFQGQSLDLGFTVLHTASDKLAANEMAWSLGMVLGGALLATVGARVFHDNMALLAASFLAMGACTVALGLAPTLLAYLIVDFLIGVGTALGSSPTYTLLQQETASDMQGRVFGLLTTFSGFGTPLGMLVFGPLAEVMDVQTIFVVGGVLTIPLGVWLWRLNRRVPASP
ncbi:MFS transporter [Bifidobacterium cuniculi]|uniref:Major facilitator superfamily protein n=1 Tax=Bifidobacterium cuniculi TaxID=1688 RepID=A0A087B3C5_9BIFI|nr:MFS transporter [Bifidobacterium cuniculi]KFI65525.1 major facilitator superfamily protein [Bifidobacterium cuniculi]